MRKLGAALLAVLLGGVLMHRASATTSLSCAQAMTLVADHPGVEANSIASIVVSQWQVMDRRTAEGGHPAIAAKMLTTPAAFSALSAQCNANPGQPLGAAAAQVYQEARQLLDGF